MYFKSAWARHKSKACFPECEYCKPYQQLNPTLTLRPAMRSRVRMTRRQILNMNEVLQKHTFKLQTDLHNAETEIVNLKIAQGHGFTAPITGK